MSREINSFDHVDQVVDLLDEDELAASLAHNLAQGNLAAVAVIEGEVERRKDELANRTHIQVLAKLHREHPELVELWQAIGDPPDQAALVIYTLAVDKILVEESGER